MSKIKFVHLHVRSDYSIVDGLIKIDLLLKKMCFLNSPAIAITDFSNFHGLIKFYKSACSMGIKPIIGVDFHMLSSFNNEIFDITILAKNNEGYHNLMYLISKSYSSGCKKLGPLIKQKWLIKYKNGLILLSGSTNGDIGIFLLRKDKVLLNKCINFYKLHFYSNYYLELVRTKQKNQDQYIKSAILLSKKENLPVVATNNVRFLNKNDFEAHSIRVSIHNGCMLSDFKKTQKYTEEQYLRTEIEMCELFSDIPEALENSVEIAKRCNVQIEKKKYFLPNFFTNPTRIEDFLVKCAHNGLKERLSILYPNFKSSDIFFKKYYQRLNDELKIINKIGFPSYFLIVMEFVQWSKQKGIPVGPGRGSGAGSLVAYALKITDLNPLDFDLLFEPFLNMERISMPDFDIDFCVKKRDLVIEHVKEKYGRDSVAQITTFGTMTAKSVIRDVGRVFGYSYSFVDRIAKLIPNDFGITLKKALKIELQLQDMYNNDEDVKLVIDMSKKLEGIIRNVGKHAGGLVISPTKITNFTPLYFDENRTNPVTQFDKDDIEYVGLVKFDFLGLKTLTIINYALKMINMLKERKKLDYINIINIPLNDLKVFNLLKKGQTTAIFQLESQGMKDLIKRLCPDSFEDIIALVALFRPGPLQSGMVDNFINRKNGKEKIYYPDIKWQHTLLKPILSSTYGIILYQEQVMKIAQTLAGYTLGEADLLRRAMCKKDPIEMKRQQLIFQAGVKKKGIDPNLGLKIFNLVEKFAGYGFSKSHSAAYALITYQTLWLKTHYPAFFMASVMTAEMDNLEKIVVLIDECLKMKLKILPPNINFGFYKFYVNENNEIVYGLGAIKGIGTSIINNIVFSRKKYGLFDNIFDFCIKIDNKKINKRVLEKLILSGAFDVFKLNRIKLIEILPHALKLSEQKNKNFFLGQKDMFGLSNYISEKIKSSFLNSSHLHYSNEFILNGEYETLGLYLSGHPITPYLKEIHYYNNGIKLRDINSNTENQVLIIIGLITSIKILRNKNGQKIAICILDDRSGRLDIFLFSKIYDKYQNLLKKNEIICAKGRIVFDNFRDNYKMIVYELISLIEIRNKYIKNISIILMKNQINILLLKEIENILKKYISGKIPINILYCQENAKNIRLILGNKWKVVVSNNFLVELRNLLGEDRIKIEF
ncbi:MAG: DNA polymerase III subunit alpha [Arsenophonus sp.]|nr:MAG: DNA polymerase III subunit alpha [Arsenophonus sp.]